MAQNLHIDSPRGIGNHNIHILHIWNTTPRRGIGNHSAHIPHI